MNISFVTILQNKYRKDNKMNSELLIDFDNLTLDDCIILYDSKGIYIEVNDGRIIGLVKE